MSNYDEVAETWTTVAKKVEEWNAEDDGFTYSMETQRASLTTDKPVEWKVVIIVEPIK